MITATYKDKVWVGTSKPTSDVLRNEEVILHTGLETLKELMEFLEENYGINPESVTIKV